MDELFRERGGKKAIIVALMGNLFLTVFNLIVGFMSGSSALISEGAHTLSDMVTTVIAYVGFRIGQKDPTSRYPLGYARAEAISGLFIVLFLVIIAWEIFEKAFKEVYLHETIPIPDYNVAIMALIGIFVNLAVSRYVIAMGEKINSPAIIADGKHQQTDIFSSIAILVAVFASHMGYPIFDPLVAILIGFLIFKIAVQIFISNINFILGRVPSEEFIQDIIDIANSVPNVQNPHNIKVDYMGNFSVVALYIDLDRNMSFEESSRIADRVQEKLKKEKSEIWFAIVHTCPA